MHILPALFPFFLRLLFAEQDRQKELEAYETYTKSQQYVEDDAKRKLGLLYDNEVVFKEQK